MNPSWLFELASVFPAIAFAVMTAAILGVPEPLVWGTAAALAIATLHALLQWAIPDIAPTARTLQFAAMRRMAFHANAGLAAIALGLNVDAGLRDAVQPVLFGTLAEGLAAPLGVMGGVLAGGWTALLLARVPRLLAESNFDGRIDASAAERVMDIGAAALLAMLAGTSLLPAPWLGGADVPSVLLASRPPGLLEAPLVALAAGIGFCLPGLLERGKAAVGRGAWIVVLDAGGATTPRRRRIARLLRHRLRQRIGAVNVLLLTSIELGGRDLHCASLLRRERRLFPRLAIEADDWAASLPSHLRWPARPQRELHTKPDLLLATVRGNVLPQDAVIVVVGNADDIVACADALPAIRYVVAWAGDPSVAPDGILPIDQLLESGFAWPSSKGASIAAVTHATAPGTAVVGRTRQIVGWSHEGALSAREVLADFRKNSHGAFDRAHQQAIKGIADMLARDAEAGTTWGESAAVDHPERWRSVAGAKSIADREDSVIKEDSVIVDEQRRQDIFIPRWWSAPVVLAQAGEGAWHPTNLPSRLDVTRMLASHLPNAWEPRRLRLRLDFDIRIYWGAHADNESGASTFQPCWVVTEHQNSIELAGDVLAQDAMEPLRELIHAPPIPALEAGIGWLVARPILRCERTAGPWARLAEFLTAIVRPSRDRDPTFAARLAKDEAWWSAMLGSASPERPSTQADARLGHVMRPASRGALFKAGQRAEVQVIAIPDALGSVRSNFRDVLRRGPGLDPTVEDTGLAWSGLPGLDECPVWRFEHDTFEGIATNVAHLVTAVRRHCVPANGSTSHIVLLGYGRGGVVARFALDALRKSLARQLTFSALTLGSPHLGTEFMEPAEGSINRLSTRALGTHLAAGLDNERALQAALIAIERRIALRRPPGWSDLSPNGMARLCRGRPVGELPAGMWLVGARRDPLDAVLRLGCNCVLPASDNPKLIDDDGFAPLNSALAFSRSGSAATRYDVSPRFHTDYLADRYSRDMIERALHEAMQAPARR